MIRFILSKDHYDSSREVEIAFETIHRKNSYTSKMTAVALGIEGKKGRFRR